MMTVISLLSVVMLLSASSSALAGATKLTASPRVPQAEFGHAVAVSRPFAVIGAPNDAGNRATSGTAYVFRQRRAQWRQVARLVARDGASFDAFGHAVAISGNVILVGAPGRDAVGLNAGAAYIFRYNGVRWKQEARLLPDTPSDVYFGWTVALSEDIAVIGAPYGESGFLSSGSVYIFRYDGTRWRQETRLISGSVGGRGLRDLFGWSVALSGDTLVVGAPLADVAYVLVARGRRWSLTARLRGSATTPTDQFGYAVAIDGTTLVVGAPQADEVGNNAGLAYLFTFDGTHWRQTARLTPTGRSPGGRFGWSVAVHGGTVAVGAPDSEGAEDLEASGTVDLFRADDARWEHVARLHARDAAAYDHFGTSVALSHDAVWGGVPGDGDAAGAVEIVRFEDLADSPAARGENSLRGDVGKPAR
jgi:hypothetical protein